jgi:hypothetical protein
VAIPIKITVENPDEILNAGLFGAGAIIRVQWSATETGSFADVSGTGSTPTIPVVAATRSYSGYDPVGTASLWYRTRYENAGATRLSDWTAPFQPGDETGGLLCSLYDVQQELGGENTADANRDENILEKIRQVSAAIEGYTGRWFAPRPLSGTTVYRTHTRFGYVLRIPKGIRSITTLGIAVIDQPDTGGTYTTATSTDYYIDPPAIERDANWPGTAIWFRSIASQRFYNASFGAEITGQFGWASVPADIQGVAVRAAVRRYIGKGGGGTAVAIGPAGTEILLPDMSGADRLTLASYRVPVVG